MEETPHIPDELVITGETYEVRERLREMGCKPHPRIKKAWVAPDPGTAAYARQIVPLSPLMKFLVDNDPETRKEIYGRQGPQAVK